jgi:hypothetical protein
MPGKQIWKDPAGAAVIAGMILAALGWISGKVSTNTAFVSVKLGVPVWLVIIALSVIVGALVRLLLQHESASQRVYSFEHLRMYRRRYLRRTVLRLSPFYRESQLRFGGRKWCSTTSSSSRRSCL